MAEHLVEAHHQRQEIVARELLAAAQVVQHVLEIVGAGLDGDESERRRLALDAVRLAEQLVDLLPEFAVGPCRHLEHRVDVAERRAAVVEEGGHELRVEVQDAEQHVHLRLHAGLRLLQLAGEHHARGDVVDAHQHLPDDGAAAHAVEVELEVLGVVAAVAAVDLHLDLGQRIDAANQVLVGALAPQQLHVLHRRLERLLGDHSSQKVLEAEPVEAVTTQQGGQGGGMRLADAEIGVEQEQPVLHGGEDVAGLVAGLECSTFVACLEPLHVGEQGHQQAREHHAHDHEDAEPRGAPGHVALELRSDGGHRHGQLAGAGTAVLQRAPRVLEQLAPAGIHLGAARITVEVRQALECRDRLEQRAILRPQPPCVGQRLCIPVRGLAELGQRVVERLHGSAQFLDRLADVRAGTEAIAHGAIVV